eukprot:1028581-Amphidinium_carterae.1
METIMQFQQQTAKLTTTNKQKDTNEHALRSTRRLSISTVTVEHSPFRAQGATVELRNTQKGVEKGGVAQKGVM